MDFFLDLPGDPDETAFELIVEDLTALGLGEDHFVSGLRYAGRDLPSRPGGISGNRDVYLVSWHSPRKMKWLALHEAG